MFAMKLAKTPTLASSFLSLYLHVTYQVQLNESSQNLIMGSFTKMYQHILVSVKIQ
jgi:hypothetical protein